MSQWHYLKVLWCYAQRKAVTFGQLAQFKLPTQGTQGTRWTQRVAEENPYFGLDQPLAPRTSASSALSG